MYHSISLPMTISQRQYEKHDSSNKQIISFWRERGGGLLCNLVQFLRNLLTMFSAVYYFGHFLIIKHFFSSSPLRCTTGLLQHFLFSPTCRLEFFRFSCRLVRCPGILADLLCNDSRPDGVRIHEQTGQEGIEDVQENDRQQLAMHK